MTSRILDLPSWWDTVYRGRFDSKIRCFWAATSRQSRGSSRKVRERIRKSAAILENGYSTKGSDMRNIFVIFLLLCSVLSGLAANAAAEGTTGALQLGAGAANVVGGPDLGLTYQVFTIQAAGIYFPSKWVAINIDFSYGLPHEYEFKDENGTDKLEVQSSYLDGLLGVYKLLSEGGFVYLGAGIVLGWGELEVRPQGSSSRDWNVLTNVGFVCGAGLALPIEDKLMGFINVRQRFIETELEVDSGDPGTYSTSNGGMEMVIGLAFAFGG